MSPIASAPLPSPVSPANPGNGTAAAVFPTPVSHAPRPVVWSVEDFHKAKSQGLFHGRRPFLVNGIILEQGEMNPPHAIAIELVDAALRTVFGVGWRIRVQLPLLLGQHTDPHPDFAVLPGTPRGPVVHPTSAALVVEVSDTTLGYDLTVKAELYAAAGVAEYWVLDLAMRCLFVFRDPAPVAANGNSYRTHLTVRSGETIATLAVPEKIMEVSALLPE